MWDLAVRDQPWTANLPVLRRTYAFDELRPELEACRIDATIVVQTIGVVEETQELLALAAAEPRVVGVVGWVDLTSPDVADRLAELAASPGGAALVGVRHQVQAESDPAWLGREDVRRGLAAVAAADLVYDFVVTPPQLPFVLDALRALPDLRCVLDHAGQPHIASRELTPWREDVEALAHEPNLSVKLSGLVTRADHTSWQAADLQPYVDVVLDNFGPGRVMIGSDWPVCLLAASYRQVMDVAAELTAALDATEQRAVFGETAQHWYRLPRPA